MLRKHRSRWVHSDLNCRQLALWAILFREGLRRAGAGRARSDELQAVARQAHRSKEQAKQKHFNSQNLRITNVKYANNVKQYTALLIQVYPLLHHTAMPLQAEIPSSPNRSVDPRVTPMVGHAMTGIGAVRLLACFLGK
jgi:hypothetical protein